MSARVGGGLRGKQCKGVPEKRCKGRRSREAATRGQKIKGEVRGEKCEGSSARGAVSEGMKTRTLLL